MENCIFCKIIKGDLPSYKLYEDDKFIVILDRFPSNLGHTLIITKKHFENIFSLTEDYSEKLFPLTVKTANILKDILNLESMNILQNNGEYSGQTVNHFHIHLIPRHKDDNVSIKWDKIDPPSEQFEKLTNLFIERF